MELSVIVMLACICLVCAASQESSEKPGDATERLVAADFEPSMEAHQYLADPSCRHEGFSAETLTEFTNDLYAAGSPKVMFGDLILEDGETFSDWFIAELPKDSAARKRCIEVWNSRLKQTDFVFDPNSDEDYLEISMVD